ncbi:hypothetical protein [Cellvibrio japonicus]|uniref:hypothetical protein n=1 Tax=Cellvibrio japonicus TaxID=155077 RepID=UPI0002D2E443|nr:hypothetical protein [Cellvibrio japonicus]QEI17238.1 hypothetical protein FY116_16570 [Cellvibrio japonicus]
MLVIIYKKPPIVEAAFSGQSILLHPLYAKRLYSVKTQRLHMRHSFPTNRSLHTFLHYHTRSLHSL